MTEPLTRKEIWEVAVAVLTAQLGPATERSAASEEQLLLALDQAQQVEATEDGFLVLAMSLSSIARNAIVELTAAGGALRQLSALAYQAGLLSDEELAMASGAEESTSAWLQRLAIEVQQKG